MGEARQVSPAGIPYPTMSPHMVPSTMPPPISAASSSKRKIPQNVLRLQHRQRASSLGIHLRTVLSNLEPVR